jgi:hypothetical protein
VTESLVCPNASHPPPAWQDLMDLLACSPSPPGARAGGRGSGTGGFRGGPAAVVAATAAAAAAAVTIETYERRLPDENRYYDQQPQLFPAGRGPSGHKVAVDFTQESEVRATRPVLQIMTLCCNILDDSKNWCRTVWVRSWGQRVF